MLSYRPVRIHRLAESINNRFLGIDSWAPNFKNTIYKNERQFPDESVGGGVREEPNHTAARGTGPLQIIQYSQSKICCSVYKR